MKYATKTSALCLSLLVLVISAVFPSPALAIGNKQRKIIDSGALFFNLELTPLCVGGGGVTGGSSAAVSAEASENIPEPHRTKFINVASTFSVNPNLLAALFLTEQGNNWKPVDGPWAMSTLSDGSPGASGPFQFMPPTWGQHKQDGDGDGVKDIQNFDDASHAAGDMASTQRVTPNTPLGDINAPFEPGTILYFSMAYNWGSGNVQDRIAAAGGTALTLKSMPQETQRYVDNMYALISSDFTTGGKGDYGEFKQYGDPVAGSGAGGDASSLVAPQRQSGCPQQLAIGGGGAPDIDIPGDCKTDAGYVNPKLGVCVGIKDGTTLTEHNPGGNVRGSVNISSDLIGKIVYGCVKVTASNVKIENSRIICYDSRDIFYDQNGGKPGAHFVSAISAVGVSGTEILNNDIVCGKDKDGSRDGGSAPCDVAIDIANGTAAFNSIHHAVDGINPRSNSKVLFNFIWGLVVENEGWLADIPDPNEITGPWSHSDAVQIYVDGASDIEVHGNFIVGNEAADSTAPNSGSQGIITSNHKVAFGSPAKITNNIIMGPFSSAVFACWGKGPCNMSNNVLDKRYKSRSTAIQVARGGGSYNCNRFSDGSPLQSSNIYGSGSASNTGCPNTEILTGEL